MTVAHPYAAGVAALATLAGGALDWYEAIPAGVVGGVVLVVAGAVGALVLSGILATRAGRATATARVETERADGYHTALRDALLDHAEPVVYIAPESPVEGVPFEWVNTRACEFWQRSAETLTTVAYSEFVHAADADALARYVADFDAGRAFGRGLVNRYTEPDTDDALEAQEWSQVGRTGYWIARPIGRQIATEARAVEAEAAARRTEDEALRAAGARLSTPLRKA